MDTELIAKLGAVTNLAHGFIYFSAEADREYAALGLADHQRGRAGVEVQQHRISPGGAHFRQRRQHVLDRDVERFLEDRRPA